MGRGTLKKVQDGSRDHPKVRDELGDPQSSGTPGICTDPSRTSLRVPRPVPNLPEGPPTRSRPPQGSSDPSCTSRRVP